MKIFIGFAYRPRDTWISDLVFPIVRAFGDEVVTGENLLGEEITDAVRASIRSCQGVIGFLTRRDPIGDTGRYTTHRWVTDEIAYGLGQKGLRIAEVRETGVDDQGGIVGDRQRITYDEVSRERCLVDLVRLIGDWHQASRSVLLQLIPPERISEIVPVYRRAGFTCQYRLLIDGNETEPIPVRLRPMTGGLFVRVDGVPNDALIQVELGHNGSSWISSFESVDAVSIVLQRG